MLTFWHEVRIRARAADAGLYRFDAVRSATHRSRSCVPSGTPPGSWRMLRSSVRDGWVQRVYQRTPYIWPRTTLSNVVGAPS